ncbi:MAG: DMT family transporter [Clostridiales bacterium]|nr:DMT family transporter [Clostridiales bacterium]
MGYIYLMTVALLFSFGGTCVKMIKPYFDPSMITFLRFFVGVLWLLLLKTVKRQPFRSGFLPSLRLHWKWLVFGALSKFLAYMAENTALSVGVSYGNILVQPVQMILMTILGATVLHESMNQYKWGGVLLCVTGILLISWNGLTPSAFFGQNLGLTLLYVLAGIGAGLFIFAQKKIADAFDMLDSNLCMFAFAALVSFLVPVSHGSVIPASTPDIRCILAICFYGFVTGIGFYLNAKAIPLVSFQMVAVLQSTMVFFSLAWGVLFFQEPITGWIISGTLMFVVGIILMQHRGAIKSET